MQSVYISPGEGGTLITFQLSFLSNNARSKKRFLKGIL